MLCQYIKATGSQTHYLYYYQVIVKMENLDSQKSESQDGAAADPRLSADAQRSERFELIWGLPWKDDVIKDFPKPIPEVMWWNDIRQTQPSCSNWTHILSRESELGSFCQLGIGAPFTSMCRRVGRIFSGGWGQKLFFMNNRQWRKWIIVSWQRRSIFLKCGRE